jgi:hypothetical protein
MNSLRDLGTFSPFGKLDPSRFKPDYGKYTTLRLIGIAPYCPNRSTGIVFSLNSI